MKKERNYEITEELLKQYQEASLNNSQDLLSEASLLYDHGHHARAYFLACASIEETGKAYSAFSARGRNLSDPGIQVAVKSKFEDHSSKMIASMVCLARKTSFDADTISYLVDLSGHLLYGREKSMYVDALEDGTITKPNAIRAKSAGDAIRLASDCLIATNHHLKQSEPDVSSAHADKFFSINPRKLQKMMSDKNFWEYFLFQM